MAFTFYQNKIFQFCFDILKDKKEIFNIIYVCLRIQKFNLEWSAKNDEIIFFQFWRVKSFKKMLISEYKFE